MVKDNKFKFTQSKCEHLFVLEFSTFCRFLTLTKANEFPSFSFIYFYTFSLRARVNLITYLLCNLILIDLRCCSLEN